jgi:hypothetical protein
MCCAYCYSTLVHLLQLKQSAEQEVLEQCSFKPKTGRGPQHAVAHQGLPVAERLYHTARERQAKLERKTAEAEASSTQVRASGDCGDAVCMDEGNSSNACYAHLYAEGFLSTKQM